MEKIVSLLQEKNLYLEKFYLMNEQELINFGEGNFDTVEAFYQAREKILELIRVVDGQIDEETLGYKGEVSDAHRIEVEVILKTKDEMVRSILAQDLQILTYIEKEKSNIIRELKASTTARRAVGAYANQERIQQLDE